MQANRQAAGTAIHQGGYAARAACFPGGHRWLSPRVETPEEIRDLILEAAETIPPERLGTTDDCGFSPFADDISTSREIAFAKIQGPYRRHAIGGIGPFENFCIRLIFFLNI